MELFGNITNSGTIPIAATEIARGPPLVYDDTHIDSERLNASGVIINNSNNSSNSNNKMDNVIAPELAPKSTNIKDVTISESRVRIDDGAPELISGGGPVGKHGAQAERRQTTKFMIGPIDVDSANKTKSFSSETPTTTPKLNYSKSGGNNNSSMSGSISGRVFDMPKRALSTRSPRKVYCIAKTAEPNEIDDLINSLYRDAMDGASMNNWRALMWKTMYICGTFLILAMCAACSVLAFITGNAVNVNNVTIGGQSALIADARTTRNIQYSIGVMTIVAASIKMFMAVFNVAKRSVELKSGAVKLRQIAREAKMLRSQNMSNGELLTKVEALYMDVDSVEINLFSSGQPDVVGMASATDFDAERLRSIVIQ